jgi:preprotein translocase subunit SecA
MVFGFLKKIFGSAQDRLVRKFSKIVVVINEWAEKYKMLSDNELRGKTEEFKKRLSQGETLDDLLPEAYAVVKETCRRLVGQEVHVSGYNQKWDMVPYDVQLIGAIALHKGTIAEMMTGEGKTLTAVLPLYLNALTGKPIHLVTVNDYLATRDCHWMSAVFKWHGITTGILLNATPPHMRKEIYKNDIVYGTASEFGFDYLRDNSMVFRKEDQVQRGHYFAVIDEVDSILIDEARTPLIISGPVPESRQMYHELEGAASALVRRQRDLCNRLATEARKELDLEGFLKEESAPQKLSETAQEALKKLWLVGKGTPRNKILARIKEHPDLRAAIDKWDLYFYNNDHKKEKAEALSQLFINVDEKGQEFELTDKGIHVWPECAGGEASFDDFTMMDISHEFLLIDQDKHLSQEEKERRKLSIQEEDAKRKERAHNLRQLLRAHLLMEKDVDYIIEEGKIVIIDENTGRPQPGRRFSDGLHQAIEAKEMVKIQEETQTYATITLQNYFRLYEKIAGMTGTAMTEANELKQIYKLDVLAIPTHKACKRVDANDEIYMTEREKYQAILKEVNDIHALGRPILIGTESVDISEKLSRIFRQNKLPHTVLNAKHHAQEAEIIAQAGRRGAITISTNMAGRGTDIKLEEGVADLGGLYVMGTTRHQSRRIDRQLRGRCARQGDPGSSKFYVSFEDQLMRLFASPKMTEILQRFRPPEGEPMSAPMLNRSIENAQKTIEQRNYMIRKHTLEYDDVMNKHRQEVYSFRNEILRTEDPTLIAISLIEDVVDESVEKHSNDIEGLREWLMQRFPVSFNQGEFDDPDRIKELVREKVVSAFKMKQKRENEKILRGRDPQEVNEMLPASRATRDLMLRKVDQLWQSHLLMMDHLRSEVMLRAIGQRDPLTEFKHEAFELFHEFGRALREEVAHDLFRFEIVTREAPNLQELISSLQLETNRSLVEETETVEEGISTPFLTGPKVGRNDDCPCGSGKKYKKCCGLLKEENASLS